MGANLTPLEDFVTGIIFAISAAMTVGLLVFVHRVGNPPRLRKSGSHKPRRWRKTDSNPRSRLSRAARSAADQLGKPGEDKAPDEPRQTHKYEHIGRLGRRDAEQHDEQRRCPENVARRLHAEIAEPRHEGGRLVYWSRMAGLSTIR